MKRIMIILLIAMMVAVSFPSVGFAQDTVIPILFVSPMPDGSVVWVSRLVVNGVEIIPPTILGPATCPTDIPQIIEFTMVQGNWSQVSEPGGTAFVFQSPDGQPRNIRMFFGSLDIPGATLTGFNQFANVTAATYRCKLQQPPAVVVPAPSAPVPAPVVGCIRPEALASQMGWQNLGFADPQFGGLKVQLNSTGNLPPSWEAIGNGKTIHQNDGDRGMGSGLWTIYPPFGCRSQLGFSS